MIPNTDPRVLALFARNIESTAGPTLYTRRPVLAWSQDGEALVLDPEQDRLAVARQLPDFHSLTCPEESRVDETGPQAWEALNAEKEATAYAEVLAERTRWHQADQEGQQKGKEQYLKEAVRRFKTSDETQDLFSTFPGPDSFSENNPRP